MRKQFRVSTKAAIYNSDRSKILVIHMSRNNDYGLPGGHIEEGESPDEAMRRELYEECGVTSGDLTRKDFFLHSNGKLVLAYVGIADDDTLSSPQNELEGIPKWVTRSEFEAIPIEQKYRELGLRSWGIMQTAENPASA